MYVSSYLICISLLSTLGHASNVRDEKNVAIKKSIEHQKDTNIKPPKGFLKPKELTRSKEPSPCHLDEEDSTNRITTGK